MADWLLVGLQLEVTNDVRNLLTGLLRVKIRNVNNLMITILVAEMKYFTKH